MATAFELLCGPSGVGKSSSLEGVVKSYRWTTRSIRKGEKDSSSFIGFESTHGFFVSEEEFLAHRAELIGVHRYPDPETGDWYGYHKKDITDALIRNKNVVEQIVDPAPLEELTREFSDYQFKKILFLQNLFDIKKRLLNRSSEDISLREVRNIEFLKEYLLRIDEFDEVFLTPPEKEINSKKAGEIIGEAIRAVENDAPFVSDYSIAGFEILMHRLETGTISKERCLSELKDLKNLIDTYDFVLLKDYPMNVLQNNQGIVNYFKSFYQNQETFFSEVPDLFSELGMFEESRQFARKIYDKIKQLSTSNTTFSEIQSEKTSFLDKMLFYFFDWDFDDYTRENVNSKELSLRVPISFLNPLVFQVDLFRRSTFYAAFNPLEEIPSEEDRVYLAMLFYIDQNLFADKIRALSVNDFDGFYGTFLDDNIREYVFREGELSFVNRREFELDVGIDVYSHFFSYLIHQTQVLDVLDSLKYEKPELVNTNLMQIINISLIDFAAGLKDDSLPDIVPRILSYSLEQLTTHALRIVEDTDKVLGKRYHVARTLSKGVNSWKNKRYFKNKPSLLGAETSQELFDTFSVEEFDSAENYFREIKDNLVKMTSLLSNAHISEKSSVYEDYKDQLEPLRELTTSIQRNNSFKNLLDVIK